VQYNRLMSESKNKNHRSLYPKVKTFDEIYTARKQREIENRPRFVATKIGAWSTLGLAVALLSYIILAAFGGGLAAMPSTGEVLFTVSKFMFVGFVAVVILRSLFILIKNIVSRATPSPRLLCVILILVFVVSVVLLAILPYFNQVNILGIGTVMVFNFVVSWVVAKTILPRFV
jgi:hypothetical protein